MPSQGAPKRGADFAFALLDAKLGHVAQDVAEIKAMMRGEYIRREEFEPVKQIIYGMVAVILVGVIGAVLSLVVRK